MLPILPSFAKITLMTIPKITSAEYSLSVHQAGHLPGGSLPEVAFLGRSNVGKSSLINTLLGRKKLVRTSSHPGCTRALNFFLVNGRWYFVDLPGFGYAAVSKELKAKWGQLVLDYLGSREALAAVVSPPGRPPPAGAGGAVSLAVSAGKQSAGHSGADQGGQIEAGGAEPAAEAPDRDPGAPGGGRRGGYLVFHRHP